MIDNVIYNSDSINLEDFLKSSYGKIWDSIQKEGYILDFQDFNEFYEITFESDIVGFIALEDLNIVKSKLIVDCYIMPEARGNKLLYDYLLKIISNTPYSIISKKPTRSFVLALLSYGLAYKVDDIVISWIDFKVDVTDLYKNSKIKRLYKKINPDFSNSFFKTDFFDLNMNCTLCRDFKNFIAKNSENLVIAEPRKFDLKKYNSRKKLKKVTSNYLANLFYLREDYEDEYWEFVNQLNKKLSSQFTVDNIIGSEDKLNDEIVKILNEVHLTPDDGFRIRENIIDSLNNGELLARFINLRFNFLANNREYIGKIVDEDVNDNYCSFCNYNLEGMYYSCSKCGHYFGEIVHKAEIIDDRIFDDLMQYGDGKLSSENIEEYFNDLSQNNEFLQDFMDFNEKFESLFGDNFDLFFNSVVENDFESVKNIMNSAPRVNELDWYFKEGKKLDNKILKLIDDKDFDEFEVFDAQSRISIYHYVKYINENVTGWKIKSYSDLHHVAFNPVQYAINQGYVEKISGDEFIDYLNKFSCDEIKSELKYFNLEVSDSKEDMINKLVEYGEFTYHVTEKGVDYLNSYPIMDFFVEYLEEFIYYEFERYYDANKDKFSLEEIGIKFVNNEFKNSFKKGDFDVYLKYLEFYFKLSFNKRDYDDAMYYLMQRLIYEINVWISNNDYFSHSFIFSFKTFMFFDKFINLNCDFDLKEIYNRAYKEFKFIHIKNHEDMIYDVVVRLLDGEHLTEIDNDLKNWMYGDEFNIGH